MIRGIYTAAAGLATATLRLGVVSNNIANAATPGYKQDRLPDEVGKPIDLMRWAVDAQGRRSAASPSAHRSASRSSTSPRARSRRRAIRSTWPSPGPASSPSRRPTARPNTPATVVFTPTSTVRCAPVTARPCWTPTASRSTPDWRRCLGRRRRHRAGRRHHRGPAAGRRLCRRASN